MAGSRLIRRSAGALPRAFVAGAVLLAAALFASGCGEGRRLGTPSGPSGPFGGAEATGTSRKGAATLKVESSAYADNDPIPPQYTATSAGGENISVPLSWGDVPKGTKSFALVMVDRSPVARSWVHWMVADIPAGITSLPAGASRTSRMPSRARELDNTSGSRGYSGPQPPPGSGVHPYQTTVYALDVSSLTLEAHAGLPEFLRAIQGKVLAEGTLTGMFSR